MTEKENVFRWKVRLKSCSFETTIIIKTVALGEDWQGNENV